MNPVDTMFLDEAATNLFLALQAQDPSSEAQNLEQAARLSVQLRDAAIPFDSRSPFDHPARRASLMKTAASLLAAKISSQTGLDASSEEAMVSESVRQASSLVNAVKLAQRRQQKAHLERGLPPGVSIVNEDEDLSRPRPGRGR